MPLHCLDAKDCAMRFMTNDRRYGKCKKREKEIMIDYENFDAKEDFRFEALEILIPKTRPQMQICY